MKGILKSGPVSGPWAIGSRDLEKVTQTLPEEIVRRKCLVIQELQKNFMLLRIGENGNACENDSECHKNGIQEDIGANKANGHTNGGPAAEERTVSAPPTRPFDSPFAVSANGRKSNNRPAVPKGDFLSQIRYELQSRHLSYSYSIADGEAAGGTDKVDAPSGTEVSKADHVASDHSTPDQSFSSEEDQQRPTVREFERERRKALREQTVMTRPLLQWRLPEDPNGADQGETDRWSMAPEQRIAFLRRLQEASVPSPPAKPFAKNGNGKSSPDQSSSTLSSESSESFAYSRGAAFGNGCYIGLTVTSKPGKTASKTAEPTAIQLPIDHGAERNGVAFSDAAANGCETRQIANSPSSFAGSAETSKLRRFWEQRIDDYVRSRPPESKRSTNSDTKKWRSLEVLSASLLSTRDQTVSSTVRSQLPVSVRMRESAFAVPLEHSSEIKASPTLCQRANGESDSPLPSIITYCNRLMETVSEVVGIGANGGHLETENGTSRNDTAKFNEPTFANSEVVRESIADAHRTRQMWQQMAASNEAHSTAPPFRPATGRLPGWPPTTGASNGGSTHPFSTNSLPRKASSGNNHHQNGELSYVDEVRWRPGSGPSSQMERQIKEQQRQGGSRVRNTIHCFENEILASHADVASTRSLLYTICPSQLTEHHHQAPPPNSPFVNGAADPLESEKFLFVNYVQTHPEVVKSLGIAVPWHALPERPPSVKVELAVIEPPDAYYGPPNGHGTFRSNAMIDLHSRDGSGDGRASNGLYKIHLQDYHDQHPHRYVKHSNASSISSSGSLKAIVRRQSQGVSDHNTNTSTPPTPCSTTPRHWKLAEWEPPPPPCNKEVSNDNTDGFVDECGNVYRSAGESLIAKEIREYRAREEELRRSRSELGLPNLEDLVSQGDHWKGTVGFEAGRWRDSRSYAHLQVNTDNERASADSCSPGRNGQQRPDEASEGRPASAGPKLQVHSPRSPNEKPHVIGGGGHKVAAYPPDNQTTSEEGSLDGAFSGHTGSEGDFMPVETRIEREVEDLRRREVELKAQRDALGIRYYPVGLAQFTPRPSLSEYSLGDTPIPDGSISADSGVCTSIREYIDVRKGKVSEVITSRIDSELAAQKKVTGSEFLTGAAKTEDQNGVHKQQMVSRSAIVSSQPYRDKTLDELQKAVPAKGTDNPSGDDANVPKTASVLIENYVESMVAGQYDLVAQDRQSGVIFSSSASHKPFENSEPLTAEKHPDTKIVERTNQDVMEEKLTKQNVKERSSFFNIDDILVSI